MACEYESRSVFERFTDLKTLEAAFKRLGRSGYYGSGLRVEAESQDKMNALKQAYQTEAAKLALKKKGFFVTETKTAAGIKLTVRA